MNVGERGTRMRTHMFMILVEDSGRFRIIVDGEEIAKFDFPKSAVVSIDGVNFDLLKTWEN